LSPTGKRARDSKGEKPQGLSGSFPCLHSDKPFYPVQSRNGKSGPFFQASTPLGHSMNQGALQKALKKFVSFDVFNQKRKIRE